MHGDITAVQSIRLYNTVHHRQHHGSDLKWADSESPHYKRNALAFGFLDQRGTHVYRMSLYTTDLNKDVQVISSEVCPLRILSTFDVFASEHVCSLEDADDSIILIRGRIPTIAAGGESRGVSIS